MGKQEVKNIKLSDLTLWTENPRDSISKDAKDIDILNVALEDTQSKWSLKKLAKSMGDIYDLSEIPTVVYHGNIPIVYDGNRRVLIGKLQKGLLTHPITKDWSFPEFPDLLPCNVCDEQTALANVLRKHGDSGSWPPLERDIFLHKFMGEEKSTFLLFDEATGLISTNPHLNKGFVKDEILTSEKLQSLGFEITKQGLKSRHSSENDQIIFQDLSLKIEDKKLSTRNSRGKVKEVLEPEIRKLIDEDYNNPLKNIGTFGNLSEQVTKKSKERKTRRTSGGYPKIFGEDLYLKNSSVNDLYRDVCDLYSFYEKNVQSLSTSFSAIIRMSLRLLCETAAKSLQYQKIDEYINKYFDSGKATLTQNHKTTLSTQHVTNANLVQILQIGAHNYDASKNMEQTLKKEF